MTDKTEDGGPAPGFDERRGIHLLSPGDIVRYRGDFWDVTGVHLAVERAHSAVTMVLPEDKFKNELRLPLSIVEGACEVYLRATPCAARKEGQGGGS